MASFIETTAVSIRKGSTLANRAFTGVLGEVTADLGFADENNNVTGTDIHATLRLHNGITSGGIPLARADFRNITTQSLAENRDLISDPDTGAIEKNLAYADLSNLEKLNSETIAGQNQIENIVNTLMDYGLANKDTSNINTKDLTDPNIHDSEDSLNKPLAYADMGNVDTADLATTKPTGRRGKNLAYYDTSNVNTKDLVSEVIHNNQNNNGNKPLAYADLLNANSTNLTVDRGSTFGPVLARADLDNVDSSIWDTLFNDIYNTETKSNKDTVIPLDPNEIIPSHYPETGAVKDYIDFYLTEKGLMKTDFSNVASWNLLYQNADVTVYNYIKQLLNSDSGFAIPEDEPLLLPTIVPLTNDPDTLKIFVTEFAEDVDGTILEGSVGGAELAIPYGITDLTSTTRLSISSGDPESTPAVFGFECTKVINEVIEDSIVISPAVYKYKLISIINPGTGFSLDTRYAVRESISEVVPVIYVNVKEVTNEGVVKVISVQPKSGYTNIGNYSSLTLSDENQHSIEIELGASPATVEGAGLLKMNLSNLNGMTNADIRAEKDSSWRIRHNVAIPATTASIIDQSEYMRIVTAGLVWDALKALKASAATNVETVIHTLLYDTLYPVGSLYITSKNSTTCPLTNLMSDTIWELVSVDKALWGGNGTNATSTIAAGVPNITGKISTVTMSSNTSDYGGAILETSKWSTYIKGNGDSDNWGSKVTFDASQDNPIYGNSNTVQPPAYRVNVWRRTR